MRQHIISILVENKFGVLSRISGLFSGRGYNIESLTVNETEKDGFSNMTVVTSGEDDVVEQIIKQLRKLVNIIRVRDVTVLPDHLERVMALVKLHATQKHRMELFGIADTFRAHVTDLTHETMIVEITGTEKKVDNFIELVRPYGLIEVLKTGVLAMSKGQTPTTEIPVK